MNRDNLRAVDYAGHMLTFIQQIDTYLLGKTIEDLRREPMVRDAVLRNMEILGEAANNLRNAYPELEEKFPEIPFTQFYGMRNHWRMGISSSISPSCGRLFSATLGI